MAACAGGSALQPLPGSSFDRRHAAAAAAPPTTSAATTYKVLHTFARGADGAVANAGVVLWNGLLYGTTAFGGTFDAGTVYSVNPSTGAEHVLHSFGSGSDGGVPYCSLLVVNDQLYGTTFSGGAHRKGTVYTLDPDTGAERVVFSFNGADGMNPLAALIYANGVLYGTTGFGGAYGKNPATLAGVVFSLTLAGKETVLHSFAGSSADGAGAYSAVTNVGSALYGTTAAGGPNSGGTVYRLALNGNVETVIHSFGGAGDGDSSHAALINVGGTLYGTTLDGGAHGAGSVFSVTPSGAERVLFSFPGGSQSNMGSWGSLASVKGVLYGTTAAGGGGCVSDGGCGTIFSVTVNGNEKLLHSFGIGNMGATPVSNLIFANGLFYGTTFSGGRDKSGVVYSLKVPRV